MKNHFIVSIFVTALIIAGCHNSSSTGQQPNTTAKAPATEQTTTTPAAPVDSFNISTIPVSDKALDSFPFVKVPPGMKYQNAPVHKKYDMIFFPVDCALTIALASRLPNPAKVSKLHLTQQSVCF